MDLSHPALTADYPLRDVEAFMLEGYGLVMVRPLHHLDTERERRFILGLSQASLRARTLGAVGEPTDAHLKMLLSLDYEKNTAMALTDFASGEILGVARMAHDPSAKELSAEFAIVVGDAWQGRGFGMLLMQRLIAIAKRAGYVHFYSDTFASNAGMISLAGRCGMSVVPVADYAQLCRLSLVLRKRARPSTRRPPAKRSRELPVGLRPAP